MLGICAGAGTSMKKPRRGGGWRARKRPRKAGEEATARRHARQARAARTSEATEGRRRRISSTRSSLSVEPSESSDGVGVGGHRPWLQWESLAKGVHEGGEARFIFGVSPAAAGSQRWRRRPLRRRIEEKGF